MKVLVIGSTGNLGSRVVARALDAGHEVMAAMTRERETDPRATPVVKSLFDLTPADLGGVDAVISCFGSGFTADPTINKDAFAKLAELTTASEDRPEVRLVSIAGAGILFTDESHATHAYEMPGYSSRMYPISMNASLGVDLLEASSNRRWTVVCPAGMFDLEAPETGDLVIGTSREPVANDAGESRVSYDDLTSFMVAVLGTDAYDRTVVSLATR